MGTDALGSSISSKLIMRYKMKIWKDFEMFKMKGWISLYHYTYRWQKKIIESFKNSSFSVPLT